MRSAVAPERRETGRRAWAGYGRLEVIGVLCRRLLVRTPCSRCSVLHRQVRCSAGRCRRVIPAAGEPERHRPGVLPARCSTEVWVGWSGCPRQDRVVRDAQPRKHSKTAANGQSRSCRGRTTLMIRTAILICAIARSCRGTNRTASVSAADGGTRRTAPDIPPSGEQRAEFLPGGPPGGPERDGPGVRNPRCR